ncbi:MAG: glycosyltransferase family 39 protein [Chloroflexota bacterium]
MNQVEEKKKVFSILWESKVFFFVIAGLITRFLFTLEEIVTPDEFAWVIQSIHFRQAILEQDWPRMVQSAHPGFITMWLGSIGTTIKLWLTPELQSEVNWILQQSWVRPQAGELSHRLFPFLQLGRNVLSVMMAGLWTAVYALLKQRIQPPFAFATVILLLTDMWIVGLTNILHVDGLLAMFSLIALLLMLPPRDNQLNFYSNWRYVLTGVAVAGAILSKVPGLLLLAIVPAVLLTQGWLSQRNPLRPLLFLLGGLIVSIGLLAPILFINPAYVFENVFLLTARETGFAAPTFFLGQVTDEPGLLFYPLTILFRQRAIITLGFIYGAVQFVRNRRGRNQLFFLLATGGFCLLFWLGLLVSDREFARYALPIYLLVALVGTLSFVRFVHTVETSLNREQIKGYAFFRMVGILLVFSGPFLLRDDPFAFINPLVGGPYTSSSLMLAGWGGAQSLASADLSDLNGQRVFTDNVPATAPFVQNPEDVFLLTAESAWLIESGDRVILSLEYRQLNPDLWQQSANDSQHSRTMRHIVQSENVLSVERHAALNRAWVYSDFEQWQLNKNLSRYKAAGVDFNDSLKLIEATTIKPNDDFNIHLLLLWETPQPEDGILQFKIVDTAGNVWIQREDLLSDIEDRLANRWTAGHTYLTIHKLPLASDMPPDDYTVQVSHFRPDGSLSGVTSIEGVFIGTVADLATFPVTVPSPQPPVALPENSPSNDQIAAVSGYSSIIGQGETLSGNIWVTHSTPAVQLDELELMIGEDVLSHPVDTSAWQNDFTYQVKANWQIPADLPAGEYAISLNKLDLGTLTIEARERNFALPDGNTLGIQFGDVIEVFSAGWVADDPFQVELVWRGISANQNDYTTFIHLKDRTGSVVAQRDLEPGKATSKVIENEVVTFSASVPLNSIDLEAIKSIAIGFYNPASGQRLTAVSKSGERLPNDQVELIINFDE